MEAKEQQVKEITLSEMREALAQRDVEMDNRDLYFLMLNGCTGYNNMDTDEVIDQWVAYEGITDTLVSIKECEDSDWTYDFYVDEDGDYNLGD